MTGQLVDEHTAARLLGGISVKTLRRWRWAKRELPYTKVGARVFYNVSDIEQYLRQRRQGTR